MSGVISYQPQYRVHPLTTPQAWNSHDSQIVLSNNSLTATMTGTAKNSLAFGLNSFTAGKYYYEVAISFSTDTRVGVGNTSSTSGGTNVLGQTADQIGWRFDGSVNSNSSIIGTWATYTSGQTLCFALDVDNRLIWGRVNAGNWNNSGTASPATGIGGLTIPAAVMASAVLPGVMLNASTLPDRASAAWALSTRAFTAPSGFGTMDQTPVTNFVSIGTALTGPPFTATATGLTQGTTYDFRVVATNLSGATASSVLVQSTTTVITGSESTEGTVVPVINGSSSSSLTDAALNTWYVGNFAANSVPTLETQGVDPAGVYQINVIATSNQQQTVTGTSLSKTSFTAGSATGTPVGIITVTTNDNSTFNGNLSLSGTDSGSFQIVGNTLETQGVDPAGVYQVSITAAPQSPISDISLSKTTFPASSATGTPVGTIAVTTNDNSSFSGSLSLSGAAAGSFQIAFVGASTLNQIYFVPAGGGSATAAKNTTTPGVLELYYHNHTVYYFDAAYVWHNWVSGTWNATIDPRGGTQSATGTQISSGSGTFDDANLVTWSITSGNVAKADDVVVSISGLPTVNTGYYGGGTSIYMGYFLTSPATNTWFLWNGSNWTSTSDPRSSGEAAAGANTNASVVNGGITLTSSMVAGSPAVAGNVNVFQLVGTAGAYQIQNVDNSGTFISGSNVVQLVYHNHTVFQKNNAGNWWWFNPSISQASNVSAPWTAFSVNSVTLTINGGGYTSGATAGSSVGIVAVNETGDTFGTGLFGGTWTVTDAVAGSGDAANFAPSGMSMVVAAGHTLSTTGHVYQIVITASVVTQ